MADAFDPYYKWLGVPPEDQPPDRYRLLGIRPFEDDPDVIEAAADQRMLVLRTYQTGRHSRFSQKLLNEVAAAKVCLLRPEKKAAYDQQLRQKLRAEAEAKIDTLPKTDLVESAPQTTVSVDAIPDIAVSTGRPLRRRKTALAWQVPVLAVSLLVVGILVVYALSRNRTPAPPPPPRAVLVFICPESERKGVTLRIDGKSKTVPPQGTVEFACKPGEYSYVAERSGFVAVEGRVTVRAGQRVKIQLAWIRLAVLVFDWPEDLRAEAKLLVDRESVEVPPTGRCECRLPPGKHDLVARRAGFKPIQQTVELKAGEEKTVALKDWQQPSGAPPQEGVLVLIWPENQRVGATVLIDGESAPVPPRGRCEYHLHPGEHRVVVDAPEIQPFEQTVTVTAGQQTIVETVLPKPKRVAPRPRPSAPYVTLDVEKRLFAYDLETDKPLPEGELYVEIWGPESWAVAARFEEGKQQVPVEGKATIKLNGKVTIKWPQIPGAEIGVKFMRLTDDLKLQTESVYKERGGIQYALTPSEMTNLKKTLPKKLAERRQRLLDLQRLLPMWGRRLQGLQRQLAVESSKPLRSRNPRSEAILSGQIRGLSNEIKKGGKEYARLPQQIQKLDALVQVLPTLDNLVNKLHNSEPKLYYRVFTETNEDG